MDARSEAGAAGAAARRHGRWLLVDLPGPHRTLGWTVVEGGFAHADGVAWLEVREEDLGPADDPRELARRALAGEGLGRRPVFLTSSSLDAWVEARAVAGGVAVHCIATVGLTNRAAIGRAPARPAGAVGTINVLCALSRPATDAALVEAVSIVAEARTAAVVSAGVRCADGAVATGTGTDCCVVAAPLAARGAAAAEPLQYVGLHTAAGEAIGRAVVEAVSRGAAAWLAAGASGRVGGG